MQDYTWIISKDTVSPDKITTYKPYYLAAFNMGVFVGYFCRGSRCTPALDGTGSPLLTLLSSTSSPPVLPSPNPFTPLWGLGTVRVDGASGFWTWMVPHWKQHGYVGHPLANCTVLQLFLLPLIINLCSVYYTCGCEQINYLISFQLFQDLPESGMVPWA
jgi:hypothetical protein